MQFSCYQAIPLYKLNAYSFDFQKLLYRYKCTSMDKFGRTSPIDGLLVQKQTSVCLYLCVCQSLFVSCLFFWLSLCLSISVFASIFVCCLFLWLSLCLLSLCLAISLLLQRVGYYVCCYLCVWLSLFCSISRVTGVCVQLSPLCLAIRLFAVSFFSYLSVSAISVFAISVFVISAVVAISVFAKILLHAVSFFGYLCV